MQLQPTSRAKFSAAKQSSATPRQQLRPQLSFYNEPPTGEVPLQEFEKLALDRLIVLKSLETLRIKGRSEKEIQAEALKLFEKHIKGPHTRQQVAQRDVLSHFILRLAYSTTEDHHVWFTEHELMLFKARFSAMDGLEQAEFLQQRQMPYDNMTDSEFATHKENLGKVFRSVGDYKHAQELMAGSISRMSFYKVPFEEVPDLIRHRHCLLHRGWAFVVRDQLTALVATEFKRRLLAALINTGNNWNRNVLHEEVDRLKEIVDILPERYVGKAYTKSERGEAISAADVPRLVQYFPLCMTSLMERLSEESHLKHLGRRQLGLFLKGIGLPLEEALKFWRRAFAARVDSSKFDKDHAYNIRYNYGHEGKRTDWSAYNCVSTVAMHPPGAGQCHGCPYKTYGEAQLRAALSRLNVNGSKIDEAVSKARGGHYQLACAATFEGKFGTACDTGIMHPAQYYDQARKLHDVKDEGKDSQPDGRIDHMPGALTPSTPAFATPRPAVGVTPPTLPPGSAAATNTPAYSLNSRLSAAAPPSTGTAGPPPSSSPAGPQTASPQP